MKKIIILSKRDDNVVCDLAINIYNLIDDVQVTILFESTRKSLFKKIVGQYENIKKNGIIWLPYRFWIFLKDLLTFYSREQIYNDKKECGINSHQTRIRALKVNNYHSEETISFLRHEGFLLGIVFGTGILDSKVFNASSMGMLNIHQGKIPEYRGQPPAFWELFNGEKEVGITLHCVSEKLDAGDIVYQDSIPIEYDDVQESLQKKLDSYVVNTVPFMIHDFINGKLSRKAIDISKGKIYKKPTIKQTLDLRRRLSNRQDKITK